MKKRLAIIWAVITTVSTLLLLLGQWEVRTNEYAVAKVVLRNATAEERKAERLFDGTETTIEDGFITVRKKKTEIIQLHLKMLDYGKTSDYDWRYNLSLTEDTLYLDYKNGAVSVTLDRTTKTVL